MRTLVLVLAAASFFFAALAAPAALSLRADIAVKDNFFKPKRVTIKKGGKVVWHWKGSVQHNVAIKKPGSSRVSKRSAIKSSGKYTAKFRRTGTWHVLCEVHPTKMKMKVIVKSP